MHRTITAVPTRVSPPPSRFPRGRPMLAVLVTLGAVASMHGALATPEQPGGRRATHGAFVVEWSDAGLTSLEAVGDGFDTDYLVAGRPLGDLVVHYRWSGPEERWKQARTDQLGDARRLGKPEPAVTTADHAEGPPPPIGILHDAEYTANADGAPALAIRTGFGFSAGHLRWHIGVRNLTARPIEIGDIALPLRMNTGPADTPAAIYEQRVLKHHFVGGQGSFLCWTRPNGIGPFLTLTPDLGTRLEFHELTDQVRDVAEYFHVYIHSAMRRSRGR